MSWKQQVMPWSAFCKMKRKKPITITNSCSYTDKDKQSLDRICFCSSKCRFIVSTINFSWWIYYGNVHSCYLHLLSNFCFTDISLSLMCKSRLHASMKWTHLTRYHIFAHLQHMCTHMHIHIHIQPSPSTKPWPAWFPSPDLAPACWCLSCIEERGEQNWT